MAKLLVTGAESGLGAALAVGLAEDGHVVAAGSPSGGWPEGATGDLQIEPVHLDPTADDRVVDADVQHLVRVLGGLDGVILDGVTGPLIPLELVPRDVLEATVDHNLVGPIRILQRAIPHLRRSTDGRIVAMSSIAATTGLPASGLCSASRSGLEAALESLRHELLPDGIRVSVVQAIRPEPTIGRDFVDPTGISHYEPLIETARGLREQASRWCDHRLVVEQVRQVLADDEPAFRHPIGAFAALAADLRAGGADPSQTVERLYHLDEWRVRVGA